MAERINPQLLRGSLDIMVLSVLAEGPLYGYRIQQRLREASEARVRVDAGTLYPLLHRLEAEKLVRSRWDSSTGRRRKWYELTRKGRRRLEREARQWYELAGCMQRLLAPVVRPAMGSA